MGKKDALWVSGGNTADGICIEGNQAMQGGMLGKPVMGETHAEPGVGPGVQKGGSFKENCCFCMYKKINFERDLNLLGDSTHRTLPLDLPVRTTVMIHSRLQTKCIGMVWGFECGQPL